MVILHTQFDLLLKSYINKTLPNMFALCKETIFIIN